MSNPSQTDRNTPVKDLLNLGEKCESWLHAINVYTKGDLADIGAVEAYVRISQQKYTTSLNLLYALFGALENIPWNMIPPDIKTDLKNQANTLQS